MAYGLKYTIPFVDVSGNAFEVRISQEGYTGEAMVLDGAPSPFVSRLDDSDDLMTPIRTSTAQISFVDDIDITAITPRHALEYTVELYSLADDEEILKWRGFLRPDIYTQPNIAGPNIISVNAASSIEVLKGFDMDILDGSGIMPAYKILQRAARQVWFTNMIHFPAVWYNRPSIETTFYGFAYPLALRISTMIYISENENALDGENPYSASPYTAFLEDFCKLFGLTLVDDGLDWYFVKSGWAGDYIKIHSDFLTDSRITDYVTESITVLSTRALHIDDDSGTVDLYGGKKEVAISIDENSENLQLPNIEDYVTLLQYDVSTKSPGGPGYSDITRFLAEYGCANESEVELIRYNLLSAVVEENFNIKSTWEDVPNTSAPFTCGAEYVKWDTSAARGDNKKNGWSPNGYILIHDTIYPASYTLDGISPSVVDSVQVAIPEHSPLVRFISKLEPRSTGTLVFNLRILATNDMYSWYKTNDTIETCEYEFSDSIPRKPLKENINISVQVGEHYFDGRTWIKSERPIIISIDIDDSNSGGWQNIKDSDVPLESMYEQASGYFMPIDQLIGGRVVVTVYSNFGKSGAVRIVRNPIGDSERKVYPSTFNIKYLLGNISLSYKPTIEYLSEQDKRNILNWQKNLHNNFSEMLDMNLNLYGEVYAGSGISRLFSEKGNPVRVILSNLYPQKSVQIEQQLLDTLAAMYEQPSQRYTLGIDYREIKPFDIYLPDVKLRPYALTGYEVDWAEHHADVKLSQVAKFAPTTAIMEDTANETQG